MYTYPCIDRNICMYIYTHQIDIYICVYICIYIERGRDIHTHYTLGSMERHFLPLYLYPSVYICICLYISTYIHSYTRLCVYMYKYIYIHIFVYIQYIYM